MANYNNTVADISSGAATPRDLTGCREIALARYFEPDGVTERPLVAADKVGIQALLKGSLQYVGKSGDPLTVETEGGVVFKINSGIINYGDLVFALIVPPTSTLLQQLWEDSGSNVLWKANAFGQDKRRGKGIVKAGEVIPQNDDGSSYLVTMPVDEWDNDWVQP